MASHSFHDPVPQQRRDKKKKTPVRRPTGKAGLLSDKQIKMVENWIDTNSNCPESDRLKFYLSLYAGLRASEIAGMQIGDLVERDGSISAAVRVRAENAKGKRERSIPMHAKIRDAVRQFRRKYPDSQYIALSSRWRQSYKKQTITALTNYLWDMYAKLGFEGCSSHSGRRTFITRLAQQVDGTRFTLRDVQKLAGHARLETTAAYIGLSPNLQNLVSRLK